MLQVQKTTDTDVALQPPITEMKHNMTIHRNKTLKSSKVLTPSQVGVTITEMKRFEITGNIVDGDIVEMGALPASCVLTDLRAEWTSENIPDSRPKISIVHFGVISGKYLSDKKRRDISPENRITYRLPGNWETCNASVSRLYQQLSRVNRKKARGIGFKGGVYMNCVTTGTITLIYAYKKIQ